MTALIALLRREVSFEEEQSSVDEQWSDYFADLIQAVGNLRNPNAASLLMTPGVLESGGIATSGLAKLGLSATPLIVEDLDKAAGPLGTEDLLYRLNLVITLDKILISKLGLPASNLSSIKSHLLKASYDSDRHVREAALRGLVQLKGEDVQLRLKEISSSDEWRNTKGVFPLRDEAAVALRRASYR